MRRHTALLGAIGLAVWAISPQALGGDWPMWRHDASRTAACGQRLPRELHLQWVRDLPARRLAWPNEPRLHFDASYEPVVMGKTLFVGSPTDGSVAAFDTRTGRRKWRFYTEGPVRFAPVAWRGKLYVGSDDGWLYCLSAADGKLLWRGRGAPDDRPDRRHLGNARLVSFWPIRGGPVLADGAVYFGAGIWPTLGVFLVAVDAETGRLLWRNGSVNYLAKVRIDHNELKDSGLSPQGYLVVAGDTLLVPNGRSMPAGLDRKTGRLRYYVQGYRHGDCRVTAMGNHAFVGRAGVVDTRTGREVGSRWAAAGKDAPSRFDGRKFHLFEGPILPYKFFPGCTAWSALVPGVVYGLERGTFYAYDLARPKISEYEKTLHGRYHVKPWRWDLPALWKLGTEFAKKRPAGAALIKAGDRLYGHAGKTLLAVEVPKAQDGRPKLVWQRAIDHTPSSLLAADGRLFVVTKEGRLYCFGPERAEPKTHPLQAAPLAKADDKTARTATAILKQAEVSEGYCVMLGLGTGRLLEELLGRSRLKVIGVDADRKKVEAARDRLVAAGLYGTRAELFVGEPLRFPFPPYLASLIVLGGPVGSASAGDLPIERLFQTLRPYGGTACLAVPPGQQDALVKRLAAAKPAEVRRAGGFVLLRRVGPLAGSAAWTHECGDAARSFFSRDGRVKPPLGVLWYGDGPDHGFWKRKDYGVGVKPQVVGGRVFALQLASRTLYAYDAFTGRLLWKRQVDAFSRYASFADGIYVAEADRCTVLDPATGEVRKVFRHEAEPGRTPFVSDIRVGKDVIVIATAPRKVRAIEKGLWDSTTLVALDRTSGKPLWKRKAKHRFNNNALALGGGRVFCIDSVSPSQTGKAERRGAKGELLPSTLLALDARTGAAKWTATRMGPHKTYGAGNWLGVRSHDDALAYSEKHKILLAGKHGRMYAFAAETGSEIWQKRIGGGQPWILKGHTFLTQSGHRFDVRTGKPAGPRVPFIRGGCNYAVANEHLLFLRDRTACYVDLAAEKAHHLRNVRSGCSNSLIAADGLLNVPNFAVGCVCNYPIQTSFALVHMPETARWAGRTPIELPPIPARPTSSTPTGATRK